MLDVHLKRELDPRLNYSGTSASGHAGHGDRIRVAAGVLELRVVPSIEEVGTRRNTDSFSDAKRLCQAKVEVVDAGPVKEVSRSVAELSRVRRDKPERGRVKEGVGRSLTLWVR